MTEYFPVFYDIETTGLNPMIEPWYNAQASEVTAVAMGWYPDYPDSLEKREIEVVVNEGNDEYEVIGEVLDRFADIVTRGYDPLIRVGWNIKQFDDPYFCARAGRLNQNAHFMMKWRRLDMMRALTLPEDWWDEEFHEGKNRNYPKQDDYARYLDIDFNDSLDGSQMPDAFEDGDYDKIAEHVLDDMNVMMEIFSQEAHACLSHFEEHYDFPEMDYWWRDI